MATRLTKPFAEIIQDLEMMLAGLNAHKQELPNELKDGITYLEAQIPAIEAKDEEHKLAKAKLHQTTSELNEMRIEAWRKRSNYSFMLKGKYGADSKILEDFGLSPRREAEPVDAPPPPATINVTDCTSKSVSLKWDSSLRKRVYEIWRARTHTHPQHYGPKTSLEKRRPNDEDYDMVATAVERRWTDNDVETEQTYWYKVRAVNAGGNSDFTEAVNATPAG